MRLIFAHKLETFLLVFAVLLWLAFQFGLLKKEYNFLDSQNVAEYQIKLGDNITGDLTFEDEKLSFRCYRQVATVNSVCGALLHITGRPDAGVDFSSYDSIEIQGSTDYPTEENRVRIAFKNFHPNYSYLDGDLTYKVNALLSQKLEGVSQLIPLDLLRVQQWWLNLFRIALEDSRPDISSVVNIDIRVLQKGPVGKYETTLTKFVLHGNYLNQSEVLAITIICVLLVASLMFRAARLNRFIALTDPLTGLTNRKGMQAWLETQRPSTQRPADLYLFFIDVDDFKKVNDTHGHKLGDDLLIFMCDQLREYLEKLDVPKRSWCLVRLSGDEFLIIFVGINGARAQCLAQSIIANLCRPMNVDDVVIDNKISLGIASASIESTDIRGVIEKADAAMYSAKNHGKGQYAFYDPLHSPSSVAYRQILDELNEIVNSGHFDLHFMPIFDAELVAMRQVLVSLRGVEARVCDMSFQDFIKVVKEPSHLQALDRCLLKQVCIFLHKHAQVIEKHQLTFCIEVSTLEFVEVDFCDFLEGLLKEYSIPVEWISLDIAELSFHQAYEANSKCCDRLNKLGIGLGIANFGGLSTLLHNLADLPIQRLSLSDSLLQRDEAEPCCQQNTIGPLFLIAQHYQLTVTLQGINTHACYQLAQELGYTYIQGDIFLPPLSCEELISGLDTKQTISPLIN